MDFQVPGGYSGCIRVTIEESQAVEFEANWEGNDRTRFLKDAQGQAWLRLLIEKHELPVISMTTRKLRSRRR